MSATPAFRAEPLGLFLHGPAPVGDNAPALFRLNPNEPLTSPIRGSARLDGADFNALMAGRWYINIATARYPTGEIRGQITPESKRRQ